MIQAIAEDVLAEPVGGETWCAMHTRSNHEKLVARSCSILGIRNYLPLIAPATDSSSRDGEVRVPLFSCYLFACVTDGSRRDLVATKGIVRLIPVPRPGQLLGELRQIDTALKAWRGIIPGPAMSFGQRVRVVRGPLTGVEGVVARRYFRRRRERLVLNVTMLGQAAMLEIDSRQLQPVDSDSNTALDAHRNHWYPGDASAHSLPEVTT